MPLTNNNTALLEFTYLTALKSGKTDILIEHIDELLNADHITKIELWNSIQLLYYLAGSKTSEYSKLVNGTLIRYCLNNELNNGISIKETSAIEKSDVQYKIMPISAFIEQYSTTSAKNPEGITALHWAVSVSAIDTIDRLLAANISLTTTPNKKGEVPLHTAFHHGNTDIITQLIRANASVLFTQDHSQKLPIHHTLYNDNFSVLKTYLNIIYLQITLFDKFLLLHLALENSKIDAFNQLFEIMIQHEGTAIKNILNYTDNQYNPLLLSACIFHCHVNIIQSLFSAGANINLPSQKLDKTTINIRGAISTIYSPSAFYPLHGACIDNNLEIIRFFLENKANVHVKTSEHSTPLHMAVMHNQSEIVDLLFAYGAEADILTEDVIHDTPFFIILSLAIEKSDNTILLKCLASEALKNHKKSAIDHINCILSGIDKTKKTTPFMQNLITLLSDYIHQMNNDTPSKKIDEANNIIINTNAAEQTKKRRKHKKKTTSKNVSASNNIDVQEEEDNEDKNDAIDDAILADLASMSLDTTTITTNTSKNNSPIIFNPQPLDFQQSVNQNSNLPSPLTHEDANEISAIFDSGTAGNIDERSLISSEPNCPIIQHQDDAPLAIMDVMATPPDIIKPVPIDKNTIHSEVLIKEKTPKKIRRIIEKIVLLENSIKHCHTIDELENTVLSVLANFKEKDKKNPTTEIAFEINRVEQIALQKKELLSIQLIKTILDETTKQIEINIQNELEILCTASDHSDHTDNTDTSDISEATFQDSHRILTEKNNRSIVSVLSEDSFTHAFNSVTSSPITTTDNTLTDTPEKRLHSNSIISEVSLDSISSTQNSISAPIIGSQPKCLENTLWNKGVHQISQALKNEHEADNAPIDQRLKFRSYGSSNYKLNPNDLDIAVFDLNNTEWVSWKQWVNESKETKNTAILQNIPFIANIIKSGGKVTAAYPKRGKYEALIIKTSFEIDGKNVSMDFNILPPGMTMESHANSLDFSIGAMYYDLQEKHMYCPIPNTLEHLKEGILWPIRNPIHMFRDDPSIMLRAMRMIAQTRTTQQNFSLSDEAIHAWQWVINENPFMLNMLFDGRNRFQAADKCYGEMVLLFSPGHALNTLAVLNKHGLLPQFFSYLNYLNDVQLQETFSLMAAVARLIDNSKKVIAPSLMYYAAHWIGIQLISVQMGNVTSGDVLSLSHGSINILREETHNECSFDIIHQNNLHTLSNLSILLYQKQAQAAAHAQARINNLAMNQSHHAWKVPSKNAVPYSKNYHYFHSDNLKKLPQNSNNANHNINHTHQPK